MIHVLSHSCQLFRFIGPENLIEFLALFNWPFIAIIKLKFTIKFLWYQKPQYAGSYDYPNYECLRYFK